MQLDHRNTKWSIRKQKRKVKLDFWTFTEEGWMVTMSPFHPRQVHLRVITTQKYPKKQLTFKPRHRPGSLGVKNGDPKNDGDLVLKSISAEPVENGVAF